MEGCRPKLRNLHAKLLPQMGIRDAGRGEQIQIDRSATGAGESVEIDRLLASTLLGALRNDWRLTVVWGEQQSRRKPERVAVKDLDGVISGKLLFCQESLNRCFSMPPHFRCRSVLLARRLRRSGVPAQIFVQIQQSGRLSIA
jgi:hypothetical protein